MTSRVSPHIEGVGRVMITSEGAHPPEFWAQITAEHIAPISDTMTGKRRIAALTLQAAIMGVLEPHHAAVHNEETTKLATVENHCDACENPAPYIDAALADIQRVAQGTEWEDHFTFGHVKPGWYDDYEALVAKVGIDNINLHTTPLTPGQISARDAWLRQEIIRREVGRHFATVQNIAKLIHKGA